MEAAISFWPGNSTADLHLLNLTLDPAAAADHDYSCNFVPSGVPDHQMFYMHWIVSRSNMSVFCTADHMALDNDVLNIGFAGTLTYNSVENAAADFVAAKTTLCAPPRDHLAYPGGG